MRTFEMLHKTNQIRLVPESLISILTPNHHATLIISGWICV